MPTRRKFLCDLSLVATSAVLVPATALAHQPIPAMRLEALGLMHFRKQLYTSFTVRAGSRATDLMLVQALACPIMPVGSEIDGNESFSLIFQGPAHSPLPQDTYEMTHPVFGRISVFIAPVGLAAATRRTYEAVFNRPTDEAELALQLARAPKRKLNIDPNQG